jgi:subtilisin family serine protease
MRQRNLFHAIGLSLCVATGCNMSSQPDDELAGDDLQTDATRAPIIGADHPNAIPGRYVVVLKDATSKTMVQATATTLDATAGVNVTNVYSVIPAFAAELSDAALGSLQADPGVKYIAVDRKVTLEAVQQNPRYGLDRIDQRTGTNGQYNDFSYPGVGVHVYIIDTGIRTSHSEFQGRVGNGISTIPNSPSPEDCNGHGTHVASSAAGTQFGVAKSAIVHPVRVLDCNGSGTFAGVIAGIDWVAQNAIRPAVANMSLGGGAFQPVDDAVTAMIAAGVPAAIAAGNQNSNACSFSPARTPTAVTVGATNNGNEGRASFSNFGTCVDIFAPGVNVLGAWHTGDNATNTISGTSMASPHVAGALAVYLQRFPRLGSLEASDGVVVEATEDVVGNPNGSPNRFLFTDFGTPDGNSCYGFCGGQAPSFQCSCDQFCQYFGDCCADFQDLCQ